jgi:iron complex outermembrane receptor protein
MFQKTRLSTAIASLSLALGAPAALAQSAAPAASPAQDPAPAPAQAPAKAATASGDTQTIVISATRRLERLQDVPLAVTALKSGEIQQAGIKDLASIVQIAPGLDYAEGNNSPGFKVRGIGSFVSTQYFTNAELPVGVVVDGVVQGIGPSLSNLGEVERIEVLKGPQGTQFGKNAAAGVISITTIRPNLDGLSGDVYGSYGNLNQYEARAAVNVPLGKTVALRASAFSSGYDGYINNVASGQKIGGNKQSGGGVKLLIKPSASLDFFLSGDVSEDKTVGGSNTRVTINALGAYPAAPAGVKPGLSNMDNADVPWLIGEQTIKRSGASLEVNYRANDYVFTSVTAHRRRDSRDWGAGSAGLETFAPGALPAFVTPNLFNSDSRAWKKQTTQELRVTSPKSDLAEYVAGYLYYDQPTLNKEFGGFLLPTPVGGHNWLINPQHGVSQVDTDVKSNAVFADGKLKLNPSASVLLGLRYTRDKVAASFTNPVYTDSPLGSAYTTGGSVNPPLFGAPGGATSPASSTTTSASKGTFKLGSEYKIDKDSMVFATFSTGYLGPIINYKFDGTPDVLKPQTNDNVTVGFKSQFLARTLTVNASLFQDKYKNLQTGFFNGASLQFVGENAATATTRGVEIEVSLKPTGFTTVGANVAFVNATFGDYCSNQAAGVAGVAACTTPSGAAGGQLSGYTLNNVPKTSASLYASHATTVFDRYALNMGANYSYRTSMRSRSADAGTESPGFGTLGLNARVGPEAQSWHVGAYVKNLFNKVNPQVDASGQGAYYMNYLTRDNLRAYGVSFDSTF